MPIRPFASSVLLALPLLLLASCATQNDAPGPTTGPCEAKARYSGSLCGPSAPCTLLSNDVVVSNSDTGLSGGFIAFGAGDAPSIALDPSCAPHILSAQGWLSTMYSSRDATGAWSSEGTPLSTYSGALAFGDEGHPLAVVSDGNWNTTLWDGSGGWTMLDQLPTSAGVDGQGLAVDENGTLHAALWGGSTNVVATYDGSWVTEDGPALGVDFDPVVATSRTGSAHVAYWTSTGAGLKNDDLVWWTSPSSPEVILRNAEGESNLAIAVSAPDAQNPAGKPHIVYTTGRQAGTGELTYVTRIGPSQWTTTELASSTTNTVLGIAASDGGDVVVLFATQRFVPTSGVDAGGYLGNETGTVMATSITSNGIQTVPLVTTSNPSAATVAIDARGVLHVAFFEAFNASSSDAATTTFTTRYLRIGSAGQ